MNKIKCFLIFLFLLSFISLKTQTPDNFEVVSLCDLDLNRTASSLNSSQLATVYPAYKGFIWNDNDNETVKFRPQGITKIDLPCREYIAVSWYGRSGYENRGARVSFADISNMEAIEYRHVLLVDEFYDTFNNIHAGGIHYLDGKLYIPDTRNGSNKRIYAFDLSDIKRVPDSELDSFYNYRYIVKKIATYSLPIQPSCISYDWDTQEFIVGTFKMECDTGCVSNIQSTFSWFETSSVHSSSPYHFNFFDRIQGIASMNNCPTPNQKLMWVSQSYGKSFNSHLFVTTYNRWPNNISGQNANFSSLTYSSYELPPGLEDLHMEQDKSTLWTHTEFGPNEGNNNRLVFAIATEDILPPPINYCNIWVDYNYSGPENGSFTNPFQTLLEAVNHVPDDGSIYIKSSNGNETPIIDVDKTFTINTWGGPSKIGE